jgi:AcrR family transcriptional regulator
MIAADRPAASSKTRARILACGRRIVARTGVRGLTVRGVAAQAKVNLGTFVYHFGTREGFVTELMESWYAPIYAQLLDTSANEEAPPLVRIRQFLLRLAAALADNRRFVRNVFIDAASEQEASIEFVKSMLARHPLLLFGLIREAQAAGELRAGDPMKIGMFLFGATLFPSMLLGVLMPERLLAGDALPFVRNVFEPEEIELRFELALFGLKPAAPCGSKDKKVKGKTMPLKRKSSRPATEARP